jgi:hypothetical protein
MLNLAENEFKTHPAARSEQICKHSGAVVAGSHAKSVVIDTRTQRLADVEFRQGDASRFLSMPITGTKRTKWA